MTKTRIIVVIGFLIAFIWSVKNGQYDDDYTPSVRMLFENDPVRSADSCARDAKGLAPERAASLLRHEEAEATAEPTAARPGAHIKDVLTLNHKKNQPK